MQDREERAATSREQERRTQSKTKHNHGNKVRCRPGGECGGGRKDVR
jgi:hypothetical protein